MCVCSMFLYYFAFIGRNRIRTSRCDIFSLSLLFHCFDFILYTDNLMRCTNTPHTFRFDILAMLLLNKTMCEMNRSRLYTETDTIYTLSFIRFFFFLIFLFTSFLLLPLLVARAKLCSICLFYSRFSVLFALPTDWNEIQWTVFRFGLRRFRSK